MNILVFTSIYPLKGTKKGFTPVVKYFCEEWVLLGHNVTVIASPNKFPLLYYLLPKPIEKKLESKLGFNLPSRFDRKEFMTVENEVNVYQLPIRKYKRGELPNNILIENNYIKIKEYLDSISFIPDIAVGHWLIPQIQYLSKVKESFNIPVHLVLHNLPRVFEETVFNNFFQKMDGIGFRNSKMLDQFNCKYPSKDKRKFLCLSGVKDYNSLTLEPYEPKERQSNSLKICFVGNLIQRKYPEKIMEAIRLLDNVDIKIELHYVGTGKMKDFIGSMKYDEKKIKLVLHGRLSRKDTYKIINRSDLLIMISEKEAYGLVYLEAMLNRTIPIASYNEGFDGIITDGENGFLVKAGNETQLALKLGEIIKLKDQEYYKIQESAFNTAVKMTDKLMAINYLNKITNETN